MFILCSEEQYGSETPGAVNHKTEATLLSPNSFQPKIIAVFAHILCDFPKKQRQWKYNFSFNYLFILIKFIKYFIRFFLFISFEWIEIKQSLVLYLFFFQMVFRFHILLFINIFMLFQQNNKHEQGIGQRKIDLFV